MQIYIKIIKKEWNMIYLLVNNDFPDYFKIHQLLIFTITKKGYIKEIYINLIDSNKYQIKYHLLPFQRVRDLSECYSNKKSIVYQEAIRRIFSFEIGDLIQHD